MVLTVDPETLECPEPRVTPECPVLPRSESRETWVSRDFLEVLDDPVSEDPLERTECPETPECPERRESPVLQESPARMVRLECPE